MSSKGGVTAKGAKLSLAWAEYPESDSRNSLLEMFILHMSLEVFPGLIGSGNLACVMPFLTICSALKLMSSSAKSQTGTFCSPSGTPHSVA